ncbi:MAG: DUF1289 domain-containing protein [Pseudomonas sp.]|uniref:DUF1289 domain-containing protein n=1 Tax=Pseudomonas sp. TaxID=306 RepID=UPI002FC6678B
MKKIKTPCVGLCSTVYGDLVCRGCKRYDYEIIAWNGYEEDQKHAVMQRLDILLAQAMAGKCEVFDIDCMMTGVQLLRIHGCSPAFVHHCAYQIITRGSSVINSLEEYGIRVLPAAASLRLTELRDILDQAFFELSHSVLEADKRQLAFVRLSNGVAMQQISTSCRES